MGVLICEELQRFLMQTIETLMDIETDIGTLFVDLNLDQMKAIDNASYVGQIQLTDFDLGLFDGRAKDWVGNLKSKC